MKLRPACRTYAKDEFERKGGEWEGGSNKERDQPHAIRVVRIAFSWERQTARTRERAGEIPQNCMIRFGFDWNLHVRVTHDSFIRDFTLAQV